ncbi:hypothetical protein L7F22_049842 [Adiantum nelumboides]|nr:hypothetical protein [Adiantum nelumboides]
MGAAWSMGDADDTKSLLQTFPFLCNDESPYKEQPSTSHPMIPNASSDDIDIFVDFPSDFEHGSCHVYDEDIVDNAFYTSKNPTTYNEAISSPQKKQWQQAMEAEYDSLISKETHQMDIQTTSLNDDLNEEIYMEQPKRSKGYKFYDPSSKNVIVNHDATFNEQLMGAAWSMGDADYTKSLLQTFPFLCNDESPYKEQPSTSHPMIPNASSDDIDIFVDFPSDFEHGSCHVYDEDIVDNAFYTSNNPTTYNEAISSPQKKQWQQAMEAEYDSLISKGYRFYDPSSKNVIVNHDATFNEQLMGAAWSMGDADYTKSLLQTFPFLCNDESPYKEQPSTSHPMIPNASSDDIDIFVDFPSDFEHGSCHVYDEDIVDNAFYTSNNPTTYNEAISSPQKKQWQQAMEADAVRKMVERWFGPYVVLHAYDNATYKLCELDGIEMNVPIAWKRIKVFKKWDGEFVLKDLDLKQVQGIEVYASDDESDDAFATANEQANKEDWHMPEDV